jgi:2-dehydro-3-deoxyphosphooctonate aldolase (KDO 8-P synthase)
MLFILGPCVIESYHHASLLAKHILVICQGLDVPFYFKASYDKANRSALGSYRGPGPAEGLNILGEIKDVWGIRVTSDIHTPDQAEPASKVLDLIQIPALLCRQTDLLVAAAKTGRAVNVKKGQFMAPQDMGNAIQKLKQNGCKEAMLTERGTTFGYNDLVVDFRSIPRMKQLGVPVIFDASHSVQRPCAQGTRSGGDSTLIPTLACAAVAAGADGIFIEVHDKPSDALSDGPNSLPLSQLEGLLKTLLRLAEARE